MEVVRVASRCFGIAREEVEQRSAAVAGNFSKDTETAEQCNNVGLQSYGSKKEMQNQGGN